VEEIYRSQRIVEKEPYEESDECLWQFFILTVEAGVHGIIEHSKFLHLSFETILHLQSKEFKTGIFPCTYAYSSCVSSV